MDDRGRLGGIERFVELRGLVEVDGAFERTHQRRHELRLIGPREVRIGIGPRHLREVRRDAAPEDGLLDREIHLRAGGLGCCRVADSLHARLALHRCCVGCRPTAGLIEQRLRRFAPHHVIGHGVGVLLVRIAGATVQAAGDGNPVPLLHDVRGLVRGGVKIRRGRERHLLALGVCDGAECVTGLGRRAADARRHRGYVVAPEHALDDVEVWEPRARALRAARADRSRVGALGRRAITATLHGRRRRVVAPRAGVQPLPQASLRLPLGVEWSTLIGVPGVLLARVRPAPEVR